MILINCQRLIVVGQPLLPQEMPSIYINLSLRKRRLRLKMCQWKCLQATGFHFFSWCRQECGAEMSGLHSRLCRGMEISNCRGEDNYMAHINNRA